MAGLRREVHIRPTPDGIYQWEAGPVVHPYTSWYPRLASPAQALSIAGPSDYWRREWPPPGTEQTLVAFPEPWPVLRATGEVDGAHGYWSPVEDVQALLPGWTDPLVEKGASRLGPGIGAVIGAIGAWPVVWEENVGGLMRWIRVTHRGIFVGTTETFQWKLDFGKPGDDPTLDEADADDKAAAFAGKFAIEWPLTHGVNALDGMYKSLQYTEVGVVEITKSAGGKPEQSYSTGWYAWPVGSRPSGTYAGSLGVLPTEVALALTLRTDYRGPRGRGRCYFPGPAGSGMAADFCFNSTFPEAAGKFLGAYIDAIKTLTGWVPVVVSEKATQLHEVKQITVGRVPDSQRRRRRSLAEAPIVQKTWT